MAGKLNKWKAARKFVQFAAFALFLALFVGSRRSAWGSSIINIPMRLDPLSMAANLIATHTWEAASALALVTVLLTIIFGRAWCGWICPLGTTLDWLAPRKPRKSNISENWRKIKCALLITIFCAAIFGNLTLLIFDPLTLLFRTLSVSIWPGLDQFISALEVGLYKIPWAQGFVAAFDGLIRPSLLPPLPTYYRFALLYLGFFAAIHLLNQLASRFWCRYLCPLGGLLGLISKFAIFRRKVNSDCQQCGRCSRTCPTGTIRAEKDFSSDPGECIMCLECLENCPDRATIFPAAIKPPEWNAYDPTRRQVLTTGGLTMAALAVASAEPVVVRDHPFLIQPPGGRSNNLLSKCIRCGECSRACPTSAIQPAVSEAGLLGIWSPILVTRLGYCDYSCNACGQVCPVGAIPPLSLEEKRLQIIGKAKIDQNRCIAWAENTPCIVCEEMCPVAEKAIILQDPKTPDGPALPEVVYDLCIGCGICEYKCPAFGDSAIRVYSVKGEV